MYCTTCWLFVSPVCFSGPLRPRVHDHDGVGVSLLQIPVWLDRKWHLKLNPF